MQKPILSKAINLILSNPRVLLPFLILAGCETLALCFLACSPHFPVSYIMAPPVRRIWGETYLHYPYIYDLLPRMFYWAKVVLAVLIGSVTGGMAVLMVARLKNRESFRLPEVFKAVCKRYVSLFLVSFILFAAAHTVMQMPQPALIKALNAHHKLLSISPKFWLGVFLPIVQFIIAVFLQSLFVYSFPFIVLKGRKFLAAMVSGIGLLLRHFGRTLLVIGLPMLLYIPVTMLRENVGFLANKTCPEIVELVLFLGILVGTVIVDALITIATTLIFLEVTDEKK